jgi:hypothetical protein
MSAFDGEVATLAADPALVKSDALPNYEIVRLSVIIDAHLRLVSPSQSISALIKGAELPWVLTCDIVFVLPPCKTAHVCEQRHNLVFSQRYPMERFKPGPRRLQECRNMAVC